MNSYETVATVQLNVTAFAGKKYVVGGNTQRGNTISIQNTKATV